MSKIREFLRSQKGKRILSLSAVVLWMGIIFLFSNQNSEKSGKLSSPIQNTLFDSTLGKKEYNTVKERNMAHLKLGKAVRSTAHFLLFTVLGVLSLVACMTFKMKLWQSVLLASVWGWLYGVLDEVHQIFVPGRTFELIDVGADALGVALGVVLTLMVIAIRKAIKASKLKGNIDG